VVVYDSKNSTFTTPRFQNIDAWKHPNVYVESLISPCSFRLRCRSYAMSLGHESGTKSHPRVGR